jgi:hypothetical protein
MAGSHRLTTNMPPISHFRVSLGGPGKPQAPTASGRIADGPNWLPHDRIKERHLWLIACPENRTHYAMKNSIIKPSPNPYKSVPQMVILRLSEDTSCSQKTTPCDPTAASIRTERTSITLSLAANANTHEILRTLIQIHRYLCKPQFH